MHGVCGGGERCPRAPQRTSLRTRRRLAKALDRGDVRRRRRLSALVADKLAIAAQLKKRRKKKDRTDYPQRATQE